MNKKRYLILLFSVFFLATVALAQQKATPKSGEGISAFLLRHNRSPKKYYKEFVRLNQKKLGKKVVLKLGFSYIIPPVAGRSLPYYINEPLFGKAEAKVKVASNSLADGCFYIVSGHGGPDPGAVGRVGRYSLHEDEYAYDIALRLAKKLMEKGAKVRIIIQDKRDGIRNNAYLSNSKRETCDGRSIPLNQTRRLKQRCQVINSYYSKDRKNYKYCRAIFIHVDSRRKRKQMDVFFYYSKTKPLSKKLAINIKNTFQSKYNRYQPNRGFEGTVSTRNLFVLANTLPASVFVELGNLQNAQDRKRLVMNSNRDALAKWIMEGFYKDYKINKK